MIKGFDFSVFKQPWLKLLKKIFFAFGGIFLMGIGISFNACAGLGCDPISVFSYGIHSFFNVNLGMAFNITNCILFLIVLVFGRRYINIGTLLHALFLGLFVSLGEVVYYAIEEIFFKFNILNDLSFKIGRSVFACFTLFFGTALLIVANVGLDSWTGLAMILRDWTNKEYKIFRIAIDVFCLVVGFLLGGVASLGITTLLAAVFGGPIIQNFVKFIKKHFLL